MNGRSEWVWVTLVRAPWLSDLVRQHWGGPPLVRVAPLSIQFSSWRWLELVGISWCRWKVWSGVVGGAIVCCNRLAGNKRTAHRDSVNRSLQPLPKQPRPSSEAMPTQHHFFGSCPCVKYSKVYWDLLEVLLCTLDAQLFLMAESWVGWQLVGSATWLSAEAAA